MPSFVPRGLEPYKKRELLEKRWLALRGAINAGASLDQVTAAAQRVRAAALAVLKARRAILDERLVSLGGRPADLALTQQLENLGGEEERWRTLTVAKIAVQSTEPHPNDVHPIRVENRTGRHRHPSARVLFPAERSGPGPVLLEVRSGSA
jgi:hypothetical protein